MMLQIARKDENHAISNHSKRYYKNESRCHRECRLPDTFGRGGVDGAIHQAAGPELLAECWTLHGCKTGDAKITKGYLLPAKYVIHTVGPIWKDGQHGEEGLLISCYKTSLALACARGVRSIAFPLISSGAYGYPKDQALRIAVRAIHDFLSHTKVDMEIYLVLYDRASYDTACKLFDGIVSYME